MAISCRTGCGQDVLYEMESFPDGFIYYMPWNLDRTIHNCQNLPENETNDELPSNIENSTIWQEYRQLEAEIGVTSYDLTFDSSETEKFEIFKKLLVLQQIKCTLFPSPLMYGYVTSDMVDLQDGVKEVWWTHLTTLSECYETVGMLDCAITALILQDKITHNQSKRILELENKKKQEQPNTTNSKYEVSIDTKLTVMQIRDTHVRELEKKIKDFLRKHYSIEKFRAENDELFLQIDESRETKNERRDVAIGKFDDHYEHLTFGSCIFIINQEVTRCKKKKELDSIFLKISSQQKREMDWVRDNFRNEIDHTVENVEEFDACAKALVIAYSARIIKHLNDLEHI